MVNIGRNKLLRLAGMWGVALCAANKNYCWAAWNMNHRAPSHLWISTVPPRPSSYSRPSAVAFTWDGNRFVDMAKESQSAVVGWPWNAMFADLDHEQAAIPRDAFATVGLAEGAIHFDESFGQRL